MKNVAERKEQILTVPGLGKEGMFTATAVQGNRDLFGGATSGEATHWLFFTPKGEYAHPRDLPVGARTIGTFDGISGEHSVEVLVTRVS